MKKLKFIFIIILIIAIIFFIVKQVEKNNKKENDEYQNYIPEEEISETQARQTIVTLYFINSDTGEISPEARLIDAVTLINNPYEELINLIIDGPKNEKLNSIISNNVKLNSANISDKCVTLDFSEGFLAVIENDENKYKVINCIVNTLTELNEVESVKFLIDGNENESINEIYTRIK